MKLSVSFFIIVNTDDPSCFHIEATTMDYRLRFSAMKSSHIRKYGEQPPIRVHTRLSPLSENYGKLSNLDTVFKSNYTYYLLEKKNFDDIESVRKYRTQLIEERNLCVCERKNENEDKYTVTFTFPFTCN